jgi:methylglutaconyl-CoA hydratase
MATSSPETGHPGAPLIEAERRGAVAFLWLNRPALRNAFNDEMIRQLSAALDGVGDDPTARVLVLGGRGAAFCAGADLHWMRRMAGYTRAQNEADARGLARMLNKLATFPKPTVARVHGAAFAGGLGLVAACDMAVAADDTQFAVTEVRLGLVPATISPYVIRAIGARACSRYFLSGERFDAAEAQRIGLVHLSASTAELDARVDALAAQLLLGSPAAQAGVKSLIRDVADVKVDARLMAMTARRIAAARASPEAKEGVQAFLDRRAPHWAAK